MVSWDEAPMSSDSDFEQRGGYASSNRPVGELPKVPPGPAPGAPSHTVNQDNTGRS
jgi:hypothetical protein